MIGMIYYGFSYAFSTVYYLIYVSITSTIIITEYLIYFAHYSLIWPYNTCFYIFVDVVVSIWNVCAYLGDYLYSSVYYVLSMIYSSAIYTIYLLYDGTILAITDWRNSLLKMFGMQILTYIVALETRVPAEPFLGVIFLAWCIGLMS